MSSFENSDLICPFCKKDTVKIIKTLGKMGITCTECSTKIIFTKVPDKERIRLFRERFNKKNPAKI